MTRFTLHDGTITFDDGGMNLLSSDALRELEHLVTELQGCLVAEQPRNSATPQPIVVFRSGRPNIFAAGADMAEMQRFSAADAEAFARLGQETFDAIER